MSLRIAAYCGCHARTGKLLGDRRFSDKVACSSVVWDTVATAPSQNPRKWWDWKTFQKQALKTLLQNPAPKGRRHFFNARGERACERATDDLIARSRVTKSTGDKHSGAANTIPAMPKVNWLSCLYHAAAAHRAWTESPRSPRHSPSRKATLLPEIGGPRPKARSRKFQAAQRSELMQRNM